MRSVFSVSSSAIGSSASTTSGSATSAGDGDPLLLARRELEGPVVDPVLEPETREPGLGARSRVAKLRRATDQRARELRHRHHALDALLPQRGDGVELTGELGHVTGVGSHVAVTVIGAW
jgi:hypothetical protein